MTQTSPLKGHMEDWLDWRSTFWALATATTSPQPQEPEPKEPEPKTDEATDLAADSDEELIGGIAARSMTEELEFRLRPF